MKRQNILYRRLYFLVFLITLIPNPLLSQKESIEKDSLTSFRGFEWGVSEEKVKNNETSEYMQTFIGFGSHSISFKGLYAGLQVRINYAFKNDKFVEGSYIIDDTENFTVEFASLREKLVEQFGRPDCWANSLPASNELWVKENDYGMFKGPELYWEFINGFIALVGSRFKDEKTITVLFVPDKSIDSYGANKTAIPEN